MWGGGERGGGETSGGVGSEFHKTIKLISNMSIVFELSKRIVSSDTQSLCDIIKTRAKDFNHVSSVWYLDCNVTTALGKVLETPGILCVKKSCIFWRSLF